MIRMQNKTKNGLALTITEPLYIYNIILMEFWEKSITNVLKSNLPFILFLALMKN